MSAEFDFDTTGNQSPYNPFTDGLPVLPPLPQGYEYAVPPSPEARAQAAYEECLRRRRRWEQSDVNVQKLGWKDLELVALSSPVPREEGMSEATYRHAVLAYYYPNGYDIRVTEDPDILELRTRPS